MATRPALRQRKASPAAAARSSPQQQQQPQSGSSTSTTTTTTSSSWLTLDLSLDEPASLLFAGLDEDPVPKENVTVTARSDSNNDNRRGQVTEAGDVEGKLPDEEAAVDPQCQGAASSGSRKFEDERNKLEERCI